RLEPKVEPVRTPAGWIAKLTVKAKATDDHMHRFLLSEESPLMVAAEVHRSGNADRFGDKRQGDAESYLNGGDSATFTREVKHPIASGQSLTLYVGLWGVGRDADDRKP